MSDYQQLTDREKRVLRLKRDHIEWTYGRIAQELGLKTMAVNNIMTKIYKKLDTKNPIEAISRASNQL